MITFISGKPGDGKSLYATKLLLDDLVEARAYVVTNIPLVPSAVCEYVSGERQRRKIDLPFAFDDSVKVVGDDDTYEFYRRRSGGLVLDPSPDFLAGEDARKRMERPEFVSWMKTEFLKIKDAGPAAQLPVHYYVDEAHNFFNAREWAKTGRGLLYYVSQHRHLHDNIWFITQVTENVEKQLRGLASELHRVRNNLRRSIGPIRLRPVFKIHKFYGMPSESAPNVTPYDIGEMTLDPAKVAGCYRTVGALGVQTQPEKIKNSGVLPWWWLIVGGVAAVAIIGAVFTLLPVLGGRAVAKGASAALGVQPSPERQTEIHRSPAESVPVNHRASVGAPIHALGYSVGGGRVNVLLSDGRTLTEAELSRVTRNYVETSTGERYYIKSRFSAASSEPLNQ